MNFLDKFGNFRDKTSICQWEGLSGQVTLESKSKFGYHSFLLVA